MDQERDVNLETDEKGNIFYEKLKVKGKSYYFRFRMASNGNKYLVLTEGSWRDNQQKYSNIYIFEENLTGFFDMLKKVEEQIVNILENSTSTV